MGYERPFRKSPEKNRKRSGAASKHGSKPAEEIKLPCSTLLFKEGRHYTGVAAIFYQGNASDAIHWRGVFFDRECKRVKYLVSIEKLTKNKIELGNVYTENVNDWDETSYTKPELDNQNTKKLEFLVSQLQKEILRTEKESRAITAPFKGYIRKNFNEQYLQIAQDNGKEVYRMTPKITLPAKIC